MLHSFSAVYDIGILHVHVCIKIFKPKVKKHHGRVVRSDRLWYRGAWARIPKWVSHRLNKSLCHPRSKWILLSKQRWLRTAEGEGRWESLRLSWFVLNMQWNQTFTTPMVTWVRKNIISTVLPLSGLNKLHSVIIFLSLSV